MSLIKKLTGRLCESCVTNMVKISDAISTINLSYADFSKGLAGSLDTTRTGGRTYLLTVKETVWVGWITGTDAELTATSNYGPNAGLIVVTVDGAASINAATPSSTKWTLFSGLPNVAHFVQISIGSAFSNAAYFSTGSSPLEVTGASPSVTTMNEWANIYDSLISSAGPRGANDTGYTPTTVMPSNSYNGSMVVKTDSTIGQILSAGSTAFISTDGGDPVLVNNSNNSMKVIETALTSGVHEYHVWGNGGGVAANDRPLSFGVSGTVLDSSGKKGLHLYGDSITYGTGVTPDLGHVDIMGTAAYFGYVGATVGVPGDSIAGLLARVSANMTLVSAGSNDVAVLAIGRNNIGAAFDAQAELDYDAIIDLLIATYSKVLCRGIFGNFPTENTKIQNIVTAIANPNVVFIDTSTWTDITYADGTHPDADGYAAIREHQKTAFASYL